MIQQRPEVGGVRDRIADLFFDLFNLQRLEQINLSLPRKHQAEGERERILDVEALVSIWYHRYRRPQGLEYTVEVVEHEGHVRVTGVTAVPERRVEPFPAGSYRVSTDQPLGDLAILLLEPEAADSFFRWGLMLEVLQRTEYVEGYVMEPLASRMLVETPGLENSFNEKLMSDPEFAADPKARLMWFYERTPFFDREHRLYPIAREE